MKKVNKVKVEVKAEKTPAKPTKEHQTEIFEYIRRNKDGKKMKVGVILGLNDKGVIKIGWSKCNFKDGDKFDPIKGVVIAKQRAKGTLFIEDAVDTPTPSCIRHQVRQFGARCVRYFKSARKLKMPV